MKMRTGGGAGSMMTFFCSARWAARSRRCGERRKGVAGGVIKGTGAKIVS